MSTELFLNFLGIRMDSRKAEGMRFTINLITPDNDREIFGRVGEHDAHEHQGFLARNPNLTLTINRSDLEQTMMGAKTLEAQIADGTATVEGDAVILKQLASTMVDSDPRSRSCRAQRPGKLRRQNPTFTTSILTKQFRARPLQNSNSSRLAVQKGAPRDRNTLSPGHHGAG